MLAKSVSAKYYMHKGRGKIFEGFCKWCLQFFADHVSINT